MIKKLKSKRIRRTIIILLLITLAALTVFYLLYRREQGIIADQKAAEAQIDPNLPIFTESDLAEFNGVDSEKPIYIGLDGLVYDVTEGSRFYAEGGGYHYLAGRDSSADLAIAGGDIIKVKYPIVGRLESSE